MSDGRAAVATPVAGRGFPASPQEEEDFVWELMDHAAPVSWSHDDAMFLHGVLLAGGSLQEIRDVYPHVDPAALYKAYLAVENLVRHLNFAWDRVAGHVSARVKPAQDDIRIVGIVSAKVSGQLTRTFAAPDPNWTAARQLVEAVVGFTDNVRQAAEEMFADTVNADGLALLHATRSGHSGFWEDPYYIPSRVGDLSPARLKRLLDYAI